jgi:hypothetical protein
MNILELAQFDGLLSFLAAFGIWPVWRRLRPADSLNPLETRLHWMLIFLFILLILRVPFMGFGVQTFFGPVTYIGASLFSFSVFLYFEILLRRHMPLATKIFASAGTLYFVFAAAFGQIHSKLDQMKLFGGFYFTLSLITCLTVLLRSRKDYSGSENRLIDLSVLALFVLGPFFLTDIASHQYPEIPRLGALGSLLFAYVSLYNQALFMQKAYLLRKLFKALVFSGVSWLPIYVLLPGLPIHAHIRIFFLLYVINLIFRIWYAVKHLDGEDEFYGFVKSVSESEKSEVRTFLKGMKDYFAGVELKILKASDLPKYKIDRWSAFYKKMKTDSLSVFDLKRFLTEEKTLETDKEIMEEIIDALESQDMSHVCLLGKNQYYLIFFQVPMVGYSSMIQLKTRLVGEFSRLIER